jgi:hypothetical protein
MVLHNRLLEVYNVGSTLERKLSAIWLNSALFCARTYSEEASFCLTDGELILDSGAFNHPAYSTTEQIPANESPTSVSSQTRFDYLDRAMRSASSYPIVEELI